MNQISDTQKKPDFANTSFDAYSPKRISYVLITKNRANFVHATLTMCRELVGPEDELIIIDGGSNDGTKEVVVKYKDVVDIFVSEPDRSGRDAYNKGILLAKGRYIKQIADEDIFYRDAMDRAAEVMDAHPEVDMLICGGTKEKMGAVTTIWHPSGINYGKSPEDVFRYRGAANVGHFVRRKAHAYAGLFPLNFNADNAYVLEFITHGAVVKFCRLKMYHHAHSVVDEEVYAKRHVIGTKDIYDTIKKYCSHSFYYKFRVQKFLRFHPTIKTIVYTPWRWRGRLRYGSTLPSKKISSEKKDAFIWDGGFS